MIYLVLFLKFYEFWLPSSAFIYWVIFFPLRFALLCSTYGNPACLGFLLCCVFGTVLKKCIHLFSVKPGMLQSISQASEVFLTHQKKMVLFSKTKSITGYISLFHFQAFQALSFGLFRVLYSAKFIAVISRPGAFRSHQISPFASDKGLSRFRASG